jgi:hypothetical protein
VGKPAAHEPYQPVFAELAIDQSFDWIDDLRPPSFWVPRLRCVKVSAARYRDTRGKTYRVGSTQAKVFHVKQFTPEA